jgi:hypothetical protein
MCIDVTAGAEDGSGGRQREIRVKLRQIAVLGGLIITVIAGLAPVPGPAAPAAKEARPAVARK